MPLEYACFLSYRHGQHALMTTIVNSLHEALSSELEALTGREVYFDRERLRGGQFYNVALSAALCRSACLVALYSPTYFDRTHLYCSREYRAMELLEAQRLQALHATADKANGLIIPIIFRGARYFPEQIKSHRQYYDFEEFSLTNPDLTRHPNFAGTITKIANYVADRYHALSSHGSDICTGCDSFVFPGDDVVAPWVDQIASRIPPATLPFREVA